MILSFIVTRGEGSHISVAVINVPIGKLWSQRKVIFAGTFVNNGAELSPTETVCEAVAVLPQASVAVHVRINL